MPFRSGIMPGLASSSFAACPWATRPFSRSVWRQQPSLRWWRDLRAPPPHCQCQNRILDISVCSSREQTTQPDRYIKQEAPEAPISVLLNGQPSSES